MSTIAVKQRRATQACDFCHTRGIRCRDATPSSCQSCIEYGQECTRTRRPKKRGTKPKSGGARTATFDNFNASISLEPQSSLVLNNRKTITALLDIYLDTIHPSFPFFCERQIWVGWRDGTFPNGPSDYMSLMCMCALSAQHAGSGAVFSDDMVTSESKGLHKSYLDEAIRLVPVDFDEPNLDMVRSYGFLALIGAQSGKAAMVQKYLGLYHGICAQLHLFDESKWASDITDCEREIRRRLWWATYRLEVHTACVLGNLVRCSEAVCNVGYPEGLHHPAFIPGRDGDFEDWFAGWNSTTDLYRVLEHAIADFRTRRGPYSSILGPREANTTTMILERLAKIQEDLLPRFGVVSSRSSDSGRNRCGFQAANILCTIHLARMISSISGGSSLQTAFLTGNDMLKHMTAIPIDYLRAIGSPLIQQLAGVGYILIGVLKKQRVSATDYAQFRRVIQSMVEFLARLKSYNQTAITAEARLADQLADLDHHIPSTHINTPTASMPDSGGAQEDPFSWSPYLGFIFPNQGNHCDLFSSNMVDNLTWS